MPHAIGVSASDTEGECQMALKGLDIDETTRLCIYTAPGDDDEGDES